MAIGAFRHVVTFQTPTTAPDGDGGVIETWADLAPPWDVSITPATVRDLERQAGGTIIATATHIVRGRYRADVDIDDRMVFDGRTFRIMGVATPDERKLELRLFAAETV